MKNSERLRKLKEKEEETKKRGYRSKRNAACDDAKSMRTGKSYDSNRTNAKFDKGGNNAPEWYAQNAQLLADAASFPYSFPLGTSYNVKKITDVPGFTTDSVGGIFVASLQPTIGVATDANSPVNVAARNLYSYVRHANSGHANYDAPDLMLYIIAMSSLYSFHAWLQRAYGTMMLYSPTNRYYPKAVIEAMGLDFDDLMSNLAQFRYLLNQVAVKVGSMCVPATLSYFARQVWMYSGIYVDSLTNKAQSYMYNPTSFFVFNALAEGDDPTQYTGGELKKLSRTIFPGAGITVAQLTGLFNEMMNPILSNEDLNIMSGDILKAFGEGQVYHIPDTPENYIVLPTYNPEVLSQIQNSNAVGGVNIDVTQDVTIGGGFLISKPYTEYANAAYTTRAVLNSGDKVITMLKDAVQPADTMVASRLITRMSLPEGQKAYVESCGSEICTRFTLVKFGFDNNSVWSVQFLSTDDGSCVLNTQIDYAGNMAEEALTKLITDLKFMSYLSQFDQHPEILLLTTITSIPSTGSKLKENTYSGSLFDLANYTVIDQQAIAKMHEVALLSEFDVLQMGR